MRSQRLVSIQRIESLTLSHTHNKILDFIFYYILTISFRILRNKMTVKYQSSNEQAAVTYIKSKERTEE